LGIAILLFVWGIASSGYCDGLEGWCRTYTSSRLNGKLDPHHTTRKSPTTS
jgi:hypothetical protein